MEEAGNGARKLTPLPRFWLSPGFCPEFMHPFLAKDLFHSRLDPDADEDIILVPVPFTDTARLIRKGQIQDTTTISPLLMDTSLYEPQ